MSEYFSLIDEPWIPCDTQDGRREEVGLLAVLCRAHELRGVADSSPLVTLCLHRLLLALVHRVVDGPTTTASWNALYAAGKFDERDVRAYLDAWRHRFDLFHPDRPFLQVRGLPFEPDDAGYLFEHRVRWGGGRDLFEHRPIDDSSRVTSSEAARGLLVLHAYSAGGLVKKVGEPTAATASPLRSGLQALVAGSTLFETLMLNLLIMAPARKRPFAPASQLPDAPSWELDPLPQRLPLAKEPVERPRGWMHLLTWQSRRLELQRDQAGKVAGVVRAVGQGLELPENVPDPLMMRKMVEKRGVIAVQLDPERAVWRDLHALARSSAADSDALRPTNLAELFNDIDPKHADLPMFPPLMVFGLAGDQARVEMVRAETFPIARQVLQDPAVGEQLRSLLSLTEEVSFGLRRALRVLAAHALRASGQADKDDISKLVEALGKDQPYWSRLRPELERWLRNPVAEDAYRSAVRQAAEVTLWKAGESLGTAGRHLAAAVAASRQLNIVLREQGLIRPEGAYGQEAQS